MIRTEFQAALDDFKRKALADLDRCIAEAKAREAEAISDCLAMAAILPSPNFLDG